jgi:hypothetical protein
MAGKKYGIDTDVADRETRDAMDEFGTGVVAMDWSYEELGKRYQHLKQVTEENFPNIWAGLEFALSVKTILNIKGCTLPFAGILLGAASSQKTLIIELFRDAYNTFYTDNFSPRSLVSHISGKTEEQLRKSDLLPKLKNKFFLTPELAPIFSARDDELLQLIGILTRVLDGNGYESDTGAQGHRGYNQDIMLGWLGASIDISPKVYKLLSTLGPKLYFYRLSRIEETEDIYFSRRNQDFESKKRKVKEALLEYLTYFDMNPGSEILKNPEDSEDDTGLRKIELTPEYDEDLAHRIIIRMALVLGRLRALVPTWETAGSQGSDYSYRMALIEEPPRAIQQLTNLAKGHAVSTGRRHITLEDLPVVIHTALSTASMERVRVFELLLQHGGILTTDIICKSLRLAKPTALKTMTELMATGLVSMEMGEGQISSKITLEDKYDWFITPDFTSLRDGKVQEVRDLCKEKYPPQAEKNQDNIEDNTRDNETITKDREIEQEVPIDSSLSGGEISLHKPLEQWTNIDFVLNACIYCLNNGGYKGPSITTSDEYETHIVSKHPGKPAYPGPADIEKYRLQIVVNGNGNRNKSKVTDMAEANLSGNGVMPGYGRGQ